MSRTPTLAGEELETWAAFATVLEWLPGALDAPLQAHDLTHFEYGVLYALAQADDGTLRMSVLAELARSSLTRLSRAVSRLERRDWVRRSTDPTDGRFTLASLTPDGRERYDRATPTHAANVHRLLLDVLTPAQHRQLRTISSRIAHAISTSEQPGRS